MTLRRRIIRIGPIRSCPISRISLCTPTCRRRETATRSRSSIRFPTLNHFSSRSWDRHCVGGRSGALCAGARSLGRGGPVARSRQPVSRGQSITHFARALGAARAGNAAAARAEIPRLDEIEAKLTAANNDYWAGQTRIQKQAAMAWAMFSGGQRDEAIAAMRQAADLDDASEKNVAMENKLVPIRALLGELYLAAGMDKEALVEFEASDKSCPTASGLLRERRPRRALLALPMRRSAITVR